MGREEGGTGRIRRDGRVPTLTLSFLHTHREGLVLSFGEHRVMYVVDAFLTIARRSFSRDGRYVACIYTRRKLVMHMVMWTEICSPCFRCNHTLACNSFVLSHSPCSDHSYRVCVPHTRAMPVCCELLRNHVVLHSANYCCVACTHRCS